ncbi:MAG: hypothetical protein ACJATT_001232 [Myxococcota bacterium]|jgi:hypothetical protein
MQRLVDFLRFHLERLLLRGLTYRLLFMGLAVITVSVVGGLALIALGGQPESPTEAIWWAFLRLTDPGYLGDDVGNGRRVISTLLTVAGYVLFMGTLVAILTQALNATIIRLQRGETPIVMSGHIVVLGLTERTHIVLTEMFRIEPRVERFLARIGRSRDLRVVVLVDELDEDVRYELEEELGELWDDRNIILRSGSALEAEQLERVDFANAAAILIPGGKEEDDDLRDATVVKILLSIVRHPTMQNLDSPPRIIAELDDARLIDVVQRSYRGHLTLLPSDAVVGRLMVQNIRHTGLSWVTSELLAMDTGADMYFHSLPALNGLGIDDARARIEHGVVLGIVRPQTRGFIALLNPDADTIVEEGDRLVVASSRFEDVRPSDEPLVDVVLDRYTAPDLIQARERSILILGWNPRVVAALAELETYPDESYTVMVVAVSAPEERRREMARWGAVPARVTVKHEVGDYTNVRDIEKLDLAAFDNLLIVGRANVEEVEQSDARTLMASLIVRDQLRNSTKRPAMLVELMDPDNAELFDGVPGEVVLSPTIMGRLLAHVSMRPELSVVLDELLTVGGAEIVYRSPSDYGLEPQTIRFDALTMVARGFGETLLGIRLSTTALDVDRDLFMAPDRDAQFDLEVSTQLAVLTTLPRPN